MAISLDDCVEQDALVRLRLEFESLDFNCDGFLSKDEQTVFLLSNALFVPTDLNKLLSRLPIDCSFETLVFELLEHLNASSDNAVPSVKSLCNDFRIFDQKGTQKLPIEFLNELLKIETPAGHSSNDLREAIIELVQGKLGNVFDYTEFVKLLLESDPVTLLPVINHRRAVEKLEPVDFSTCKTANEAYGLIASNWRNIVKDDLNSNFLINMRGNTLMNDGNIKTGVVSMMKELNDCSNESKIKNPALPFPRPQNDANTLALKLVNKEEGNAKDQEHQDATVTHNNHNEIYLFSAPEPTIRSAPAQKFDEEAIEPTILSGASLVHNHNHHPTGLMTLSHLRDASVCSMNNNDQVEFGGDEPNPLPPPAVGPISKIPGPSLAKKGSGGQVEGIQQVQEMDGVASDWGVSISSWMKVEPFVRDSLGVPAHLLVHVLKFVREGVKMELPSPWVARVVSEDLKTKLDTPTSKSKMYFEHRGFMKTQWDHPLEDFLKTVVNQVIISFRFPGYFAHEQEIDEVIDRDILKRLMIEMVKQVVDVKEKWVGPFSLHLKDSEMPLFFFKLSDDFDRDVGSNENNLHTFVYHLKKSVDAGGVTVERRSDLPQRSIANEIYVKLNIIKLICLAAGVDIKDVFIGDNLKTIAKNASSKVCLKVESNETKKLLGHIAALIGLPDGVKSHFGLQK